MLSWNVKPVEDRAKPAPTRRDEQLNREEWAVAMHLVVCATGRKLPLPARLPKCLRPASSDQNQPLEEEQQQQQPRRRLGVDPAADKKAREGEYPVQHHEKVPKAKTATRSSPPVDLKRATKEFKNGGMEAGEFLPVLEVG